MTPFSYCQDSLQKQGLLPDWATMEISGLEKGYSKVPGLEPLLKDGLRI
ncbi:hypothetical protein C5167_035464 [Papaver somniferum]|uniref:Uncharacterized protein n=1 Tax=Papaver somniferum TaxID=3469 RepID=A0A4Y7KG30_PAPSO|nr:hypothetical protein C5167_035464 [Papaver somniferum]